MFNTEGVASDHQAVHLMAKIPRVPDYTIERYSYVKQTEEGDRKLAEYLNGVDWRLVTNNTDVNKMVDALHDIFEQGTSHSYKTITTTRKSNQPQWIDKYVLDLISNRRTIFRREKRSEAWKALKRKTRAIIKKRKAFFNKQKREKMVGADSRTFHKCVKSFVNDEKTKGWNPMQMYPSLDAEAVANKCADFFNGISQEYPPLDKSKIPSTFDGEQLIITNKLVEQEIRKGKKPKSRVPGDIFVTALVDNLPVLSPVITKIYNQIVKSETWPKAWRTEYVTVIPKGNVPEGPAQCRNISCTNFLSKVMERLVLSLSLIHI